MNEWMRCVVQKYGLVYAQVQVEGQERNAIQLYIWVTGLEKKAEKKLEMGYVAIPQVQQ